MKRAILFAALAIFLLVIGLIAALTLNFALMNGDENGKKPFYVGVTYCGNTTAEAKQLIDRVKNYTNLFVLQSGPLMRDKAAVMEIGDYAISCGLHFAAFFESGALFPPQEARWLGFAEERWGDMFAGVYFGDEPGGKMLDSYVNLSEGPTQGAVVKLGTGGVQSGNTTYLPNGTIIISDGNYLIPDDSFWNFTSNTNPDTFESNQTSTTITYFPNGSIAIKESITLVLFYSNGSIVVQDSRDYFFTMENGSDRITLVESYETVLSRHPIPNYDAAVDIFVSRNQKILDSLSKQWQLGNRSFPIFTSDYALYWWDYLSGYDVVLAQLGWNNTVAQEIGLVRGAANLQGKSWGVILTWKYKEPPYLASGEEIYSQMRTAYECGAEYVVVFNYAENMTGPYGILQKEHFDALERFWRDVVQNPFVWHGTVKAEAALVLPKDYGWGMRNPQDTIWGLWSPDSTAEQIWAQLQSKLQQYGSKLDIVYDDPVYPVAGKYPNIIYWNQTG